MELKKRVFEVLEQTHLMSLGTIDEHGPWVADVIFLFDEELNIYWTSEQSCRHSQAILKNPNVAGTITKSTESKQNNLGIQFEGTAEKINNKNEELAIKHLQKRKHEPTEELVNTFKNKNWYKLTPTKIELIDEEHFGFEKQKVSF